MTKITLLILLLLLLRQLSPAQEKYYQLDFNKDNISWVWLGQLQYAQKIGDEQRLYFRNNYVGNLYRESVSGNKWKDENRLNLGWEKHFGKKFQGETRFESYIFSDENAALEFNKNLLTQHLRYAVTPKITLTPALGWAAENIYGKRDNGWYTEIVSEIKNQDLSGYVNRTEGKSSIFYFPERRNQEHRYYTSFNKKFSEYAIDSIRVGYEYIKNSYYLSGGNDLENVEINARFLYNRLRYIISPKSDFEIETRLQNRDILQSNPMLENHREELNFVNRFQWQYVSVKYLSRLSFASSQITNLASRRGGAGRETRTDLEGLQSAVNWDNNWRISGRDRLKLNFSYTKYEYTSPDSTRNIDEDDIRFISGLVYQHDFSPYFSAGLHANVYLYHQIYIDKSRSGNNNWNRIFQLAGSFRHQIPRVLDHRSRFKILANYTVYDFEDIQPEIRSYIHRKLIYSDTLKIFLTPGVNFESTYQLEKEDNGTFFKDIFAQRISRKMTSHFIGLNLVYYRIAGIKWTSGVDWYLRREWGFLIEKTLTRNYFAFSPNLSVLYNLGKSLLLHATISRKMYRDLNLPKQYYTSGFLRLRYVF